MGNLMSQVVNKLIDDRCDLFGINSTILYLLDIGCGRSELLDLGFDEESIDEMIAQKIEEGEDIC